LPSPQERVRARSNVNLWKIPLFITLGSLGLFGLTCAIDVLDANGTIHLPAWFTNGSIDDARAILGAMLGCVSTVLALIFSVALLVLSMVATLFGPRLLYRFLRDWVTQVTIGLFLGTFVFICLVFLVTHQDQNSKFIPQASIITAWLLVLVSFAFLVVYSHRVAASIQNPDLVARIVDDVRPEFARLQHKGGKAERPEVIERQIEEGAEVLCTESGYVQEIDHERIVREAAAASVVVHVFFRQGQFVLRGERLASVWPASKASPVTTRLELDVQLGRHRTVRQDAEFGIAQVVEIALRALSPAVNDTFTGVGCVDWLGDALLVAADTSAIGATWFDEAGAARLYVRAVTLERLIRLAFDQIRQSAGDNPAVLIRMLDTIRRIAPRMPTEAERKVLADEADAIREAATAKVPIQLDLRDVEAAWKRAKGVLDRPSSPPRKRALDGDAVAVG
jgi:uncharacterized membrane protein